MTTNKISFISMMFVVSIVYLCMSMIIKFNYVDLSYMLVLIVYFIRFIYLKKYITEEWQKHSFFLTKNSWYNEKEVKTWLIPTVIY